MALKPRRILQRLSVRERFMREKGASRDVTHFIASLERGLLCVWFARARGEKKDDKWNIFAHERR